MCNKHKQINFHKFLELYHIHKLIKIETTTKIKTNNIYICIYNVYSQLQVESRSSKCPSFRPSVRPSVPLYLLQFLSNSFNIAHRASLQCRGRHGRNFLFFSGHVSGHFRAVKKGLKI